MFTFSPVLPMEEESGHAAACLRATCPTGVLVSDLDVRGATARAAVPPGERRLAPDKLAATAELVSPTLVRDSLPSRAHALVAWLVVVDALAIGVALTSAYIGRFGTRTDAVLTSGVSGLAVSALLGIAWLATIAAQRGYEPRFLGVGGEEYSRVTKATFVLFGAMAIASYVVKFELARGFVGLAFPVGLLALLVGRWTVRQWLVGQRRVGKLCHRVVVLGERSAVCDFIAQLRVEPKAGFTVVGACLPDRDQKLRISDRVDVLGDYADVASVAVAVRADVVAVTASDSVTPDSLRRIAWSLEGLDVDLVVAPAMTEVAGPRVSVRPVAGLPLLYVDEPRFAGWQRIVKGTIDRVGALLGLVLLSPLLLLVALAVRLDSSGPAFFRQDRVGLDGRSFRVLKFRTMVVDAEERRAELGEMNEGDGLLFKISQDPRVTTVGGFLRRTSIDELPQLWNVLRGEMSLVGPRPLAVDGEAFEDDEHRRHLVKPGMTGLWQVSGREDQSWDAAVRLDLYYVENWSLAMDLLILARTVVAVFRGR
jgi:exopolysaccharide biosynthesis polyprenyl glycosylphosphotransferase